MQKLITTLISNHLFAKEVLAFLLGFCFCSLMHMRSELALMSTLLSEEQAAINSRTSHAVESYKQMYNLAIGGSE